MDTLVRAEVHCFACGYVPATVVQTGLSPTSTLRLVKSPNGPGVKTYPGQPPRCGRCDGPLYLEDIVA